QAVKARNMKMGFYYIGPWDWTFNENPIQNFSTYVTNGPLDPKFAEYVKNHWFELIDKYKPSILWGDIGYPPVGDEMELFAYFYNKIPDGVINDRWMKLGKNIRRLLKFWPIGALGSWLAKRAFIKGSMTSLKPPHYDFLTPEYTTLKTIAQEKWETTRGIGYSFGYNKMEPESNYLTVKELVHMLIDIVSKNGNLLLNVGPKADGSIPEIQSQRLIGLGKWLDVNGDAIFETRLWKKAEDMTQEGIPVRYTQKENALYIILLAKPTSTSISLKNMGFKGNMTVTLLGDETLLETKLDGTTLTIKLPDDIPSTPAISLKISPLPP
ncbi:MAG TPA: alpha-L-fucosidase, partial [Candidatus Deferrimicrobium sp.]|nr:alpha-L-fucosidase [Candidatus Deferrimicrobium sp.]